MDAHPGVKITIDCLESDTSTASPDWSQKYVEKTVVALTSGDAADIIDLDMTPIYRYANSGYFEDFYAYMEKDPDIQMENYYTNIFEALETADGQLPVLPMAVVFTPLIFNDYMMEALGVDVAKAYPTAWDGGTWWTCSSARWRKGEPTRTRFLRKIRARPCWISTSCQLLWICEMSRLISKAKTF